MKPTLWDPQIKISLSISLSEASSLRSTDRNLTVNSLPEELAHGDPTPLLSYWPAPAPLHQVGDPYWIPKSNTCSSSYHDLIIVFLQPWDIDVVGLRHYHRRSEGSNVCGTVLCDLYGGRGFGPHFRNGWLLGRALFSNASTVAQGGPPPTGNRDPSFGDVT